MRQINGAGVFSKMALAKIGKTKNAVITSIRNPGEIEVLAGAKNFALIDVVAPREIRFARILFRMAPSGEKITFAEFCRAEAREVTSADSAAQQLEKCAAMAVFPSPMAAICRHFIIRLINVWHRLISLHAI